MIGYYVHHVGRGHLHRARAVQREIEEPMTILSSLDPSTVGTASPVPLTRDDCGAAPSDSTAGGRLHWAPLYEDGLSQRMHQISAWLESSRPRLLVVDVSVEVALLARLHGVPVVAVVLPGRRGDPPHQLGFDIAHELVAAWPHSATPAMLPGLTYEVRDRVRAVGAISRFGPSPPGVATARPRTGRRKVVVLGGAGGSVLDVRSLDRAAGSTPQWDWVVCGPPGRWHADVAGLLAEADVVVCHAGQNAIAEVAATRRPAVVVPQDRPHDEQAVTAAALRDGGWPVLVEETFPATGWADRLERAAGLDARGWAGWCDGHGPRRFGHVLGSVASGGGAR